MGWAELPQSMSRILAFKLMLHLIGDGKHYFAKVFYMHFWTINILFEVIMVIKKIDNKSTLDTTWIMVNKQNYIANSLINQSQ